MPFEKYLKRERTVELQGTTRKEAFAELVTAICESEPELDSADLMGAIEDRERLTSTRIGKSIAIPHARVAGIRRPVIAVGRSRRGVEYDLHTDERIHLIAMILANEADHLETLSGVVARLAATGFRERAINAYDADELYDLLATAPVVRMERRAGEDQQNRIIFEHALEIAKSIDARAFLLHIGGIELPEIVSQVGLPLIVFSADPDQPVPEGAKFVHFPFPAVHADSRLELSLLFARAAGYVGPDQKVISVLGSEEGPYWDRIAVSNTSSGFQRFLAADFLKPVVDSGVGIDQRVFARVLQLATTIAMEGREGEPVGTIFVLGDSERVAEHCQQLIANPFKGYHEAERNILDPSMEESIKEFARIDGAFVIRNDGVILSAGTYIRASHVSVELPRGLGSRHMAAASITASTDAIAVALSESTRTVSLFRSGKRIFSS